MGCIALVRCVLVWRCGLAVVVWHPYAGFSQTTTLHQHTSNQNNTTHEITQQIIRKLLRMDVLTSETCWAINNEILVIKQVTSSWSQLFNYKAVRISNECHRLCFSFRYAILKYSLKYVHSELTSFRSPSALVGNRWHYWCARPWNSCQLRVRSFEQRETHYIRPGIFLEQPNSLFKWSQLGAHYFLVYLFQLLYMFRAIMCPSSGALIGESLVCRPDSHPYRLNNTSVA